MCVRVCVCVIILWGLDPLVLGIEDKGTAFVVWVSPPLPVSPHPVSSSAALWAASSPSPLLCIFSVAHGVWPPGWVSVYALICFSRPDSLPVASLRAPHLLSVGIWEPRPRVPFTLPHLGCRHHDPPGYLGRERGLILDPPFLSPRRAVCPGAPPPSLPCPGCAHPRPRLT